jgi:hypothetical protein
MSRVGSEARLGPPLHRLSLATTRSEPSRTRGTRVQIVLEATFGSRLVRPPGRPRKQVFLRRGARQVPLPAPVGLHHVDRCGCLHRRVATSEDDLPPVGRPGWSEVVPRVPRQVPLPAPIGVNARVTLMKANFELACAAPRGKPRLRAEQGPRRAAGVQARGVRQRRCGRPPLVCRIRWSTRRISGPFQTRNSSRRTGRETPVRPPTGSL